MNNIAKFDSRNVFGPAVTFGVLTRTLYQKKQTLSSHERAQGPEIRDLLLLDLTVETGHKYQSFRKKTHVAFFDTCGLLFGVHTSPKRDPKSYKYACHESQNSEPNVHLNPVDALRRVHSIPCKVLSK